MKKRSFLFTFMFSLLVGMSPLFAQLRLPAIIGSHMVLQQNSAVKIWGWCNPSEKIRINTTWDTTTYSTVGSGNAKWSIVIKTPAAGGPYKISIKGNSSIELEDVMIGEVWVCSGQSNMEWSVNLGLPYRDEAANALNKSIRFFHIPKTTAEYPQDDVTAKWIVCNPEDMKRFSAVGYFFGDKLQKELKVPIGLVNASWGGTPAEVWTPEEVVEKDAVLKQAASRLTAAQWWPVVPGATYNAMINPLTNYNIAGAIWYQGESNTGTAASYQQLFTSMIGAWRKAWQKDFPFYYVQIAPYAGYGNKNIAPLLREAQTKSMVYPNTGMVVVSDLVDNINDIHPRMKKEVGFRLANYALVQTYGKSGISNKSPFYQRMQIEKDKIRIYFEGAENGLVSKGGAPTEFYIAGEDKNFIPAQAKIERNTVVVWSKIVMKPVAVRFGFSNEAMPNLFSKEGLPVNLFRTDDWPVDTGEVKKLAIATGK
ncbi:sialate O-acetylesterase [Chitinophagaceae bacterium LB-8]|uniref:Sialate O-acetylesterase n=1 Tax=Paraflavisolibacter caeni TaxID=2982496 RepID=A0A9X2XWG7_9BACT|nr:sialate O-acetylesterase [Paraflavisolibacter caeni]MCU7548988.1 sialate O-acetylesterase [Paraflavisolibacter caeni]